MNAPRKNAATTRGRPFEPGNPGRRKGAKHRVTLAAEALLDGEAEALTRKAIDLAKAGDMVALRLCLERILPPRRGRPVIFDLPPIKVASDVLPALGAVAQAVSEGSLTTEDAIALSSLIDAQRRAIETTEMEARIRTLEARLADVD